MLGLLLGLSAALVVPGAAAQAQQDGSRRSRGRAPAWSNDPGFLRRAGEAARRVARRTGASLQPGDARWPWRCMRRESTTAGIAAALLLAARMDGDFGRGGNPFEGGRGLVSDLADLGLDPRAALDLVDVPGLRATRWARAVWEAGMNARLAELGYLL